MPVDCVRPDGKGLTPNQSYQHWVVVDLEVPWNWEFSIYALWGNNMYEHKSDLVEVSWICSWCSKSNRCQLWLRDLGKAPSGAPDVPLPGPGILSDSHSCLHLLKAWLLECALHGTILENHSKVSIGPEYGGMDSDEHTKMTLLLHELHWFPLSLASRCW